jgi:hypothetical protein
LRWDGEDAQGRACASGVYVARLHTATRQEQVRLTLVR